MPISLPVIGPAELVWKKKMSKEATEVAVAVVFAPDGRFLMSSRPEGKVYAGYWEFPGGKVEAGETVEEALKREMKEELDCGIEDCREVLVTTFTYPHATVRLHFIQCRMTSDAPTCMEGQKYRFCSLEDLPSPILPATLPVLEQVVTAGTL